MEGLDELVGGGLPRGGLIVLAGNPGTGKTISSAQFLYRGCVDYGERGVYASFAEDREAFYRNMKALGLDFERLEKEGRFSFLDLVTVREEAVSTVVELIVGKVAELGAKRLVVDSFSAMAQAFKDPHDARIVLHDIMYRIVRSMGCTTILIVEVPHGEARIGLGVEEFVADAIIVLKRDLLDGRPLRELEVIKTRGAPTPEAQAVFTLKGGFRAFPPFKYKPVERPRRFRTRPDTQERFSTGSPDLDELLGGGYPRGSMVLFDIADDVSAEHYLLALLPTVWNFMSQGRGVTITPSIGIEYDLIRERTEERGFTSEDINRLLKVYMRYHPGVRAKPNVVTFEGEDLSKDLRERLKLVQEFMEESGQPVLDVNGADALIDAYGVRGALSYMKACITMAREAKGLCMIMFKPGYPRLARALSPIADVHLRFARRHGAVLVYGVSPRTNIYALEVDTSEGYPMPKLTPVV
jgi:KaiC/GvpD/RAD55 family RecA-like ATPase